MNRSFSPRHGSPRTSNFPNHFPMTQGQQFQSPYSSNASPQFQYVSPQSSPNFYQNNNHFNQMSDVCQRNSFDLPSPKNSHFSSPRFHSSPKVYSPRNRSPYGSYNASPNSSWNSQPNRSGRDSSSYFADTSGSPYSIPNKKQKYQNQKNRFSESESNPGHSYNIEEYIHPSMLDDPWEKDMIEYKKKKENSSQSKGCDS